MLCVCRRAIDLKLYPGSELASTALGLMISGGFVLFGVMAMSITSKLLIIIKGEYHMKNKKLKPIHPGEVLMEDFLKPMGISQYRLAQDISVPARRINEIVHCTRAVTADTALRLGRFFGISAQFWVNLQSHYDLAVEEDHLGKKLEREVHVFATA
jgi:addiction module HigA family antidote